MRDLQHRLAFQPSVTSTALAAAGTTNGASVDTLGYEAVTLFVQLSAFTAGTFTPTIQTSPDNANWTVAPAGAIDASSYIGGVAPAALTANGTLVIGIQAPTTLTAGAIAMLRYVRAVIVAAGGTVGGTVVALFVLGYPRHSGIAV